MSKPVASDVEQPKGSVEQFKRSIVAVLVDGKRCGTGFFVAPGLVATCAHVIDNLAEAIPTNRQVRVRLAATGDALRAQIVEWRSTKTEDLALLQCEPRAEDVTILRLRDHGSEDGFICDTLGYPEVIDAVGIIGKAEVRGLVETQSGRWRIQLDSKELAPGFSGAPLIDPRCGRAVGVVVSGVGHGNPELLGKLADTAFAIPVKTLAAVRGDLFVEPPTLEDDHRQAVEKLRQMATIVLGGSKELTDILADKVQQRLAQEGPLKASDTYRADEVTKVLFGSPLDKVLDIIIECYHQLAAAASRSDDPALRTIVSFGSHLFPAIYDEHQLRDIRAGIENQQPFLVLPSTSQTIVELLMAGVDGRRAMFAAPFSKDNLPGGEQQIQEPPESGICTDSFFVEFQEALYEKLRIFKAFRDPKNINRATANELKLNRRFYYVFPEVGQPQLDRQREQIVEQLKSRYRDIVFVKQCRPKDDNKEFDLLHRLQDMFGSTIG
ncbi:MAG: trypsin-like peptidase domain-containing protein [Pirellulaceae bacterium]|nr:trypsin-like peptidase domain-containing protein [Pirellulaceae bacterium]